ncbi:MAG: tetratricopeptide repeat protein [Flavobacteriales bacterium]|nr:tetratricopeptide repeat protein [Flavobacteriales bacterium]
MKRVLFFMSALLFALAIQAQTQANLDSVYTVWQDETQSDSVRVSAFQKYTWNGFLYSKPDSAMRLAEDLHSYAKAHNYPKAAASGFIIQGASNHIKGNYPLALDYNEKALKIQEEIGYKKGMAISLNNIGLIYAELGNDMRALEYYEKALKLNEEIDERIEVASCLGNIAGIYIDQGKYSLALEYLEKTLKTMEEFGIKRGVATCLANIGEIYNLQGDYSKAMEYNLRALNMREEIGEKQGIAGSLISIGFLHKVQRNYPSAIDFCKRGLDLAGEIKALQGEKEACQCLYDTYKAMGKGNEALVYIERIQVIDDSLNTEETTKKLQQMEFAKRVFADSTAKAEEARLVEEAHKEEVQKGKQTRNIAIASGLFFLLLSGGFYSRWRYVRKSNAIVEKEKERSNNLLLNILPADIAEELKLFGKAEARDFDMVSILFSDFKGFTEASAKLSAQDLVREINTCFEAFDGIMAKYGIEKIKTIGDAYMAAGGLPVPTDDSVKNTVLAAIEMQAFIGARSEELGARGLPFFEMRVGIHTGPVVAGIVGVKKFQYDIWGDTVNTASRMESAGEVGKVNVSHATYELLKDDADFSFESRGKIEAKGKGKMEMWFAHYTHSR